MKKVYLAEDVNKLLDELQKKYSIECNDLFGKLLLKNALIEISELQKLVNDANRMTVHMDKWQVPKDLITNYKKIKKNLRNK